MSTGDGPDDNSDNNSADNTVPSNFRSDIHNNSAENQPASNKRGVASGHLDQDNVKGVYIAARNRRTLLLVAKLLIVVAVVVGLTWAGQSALDQWRAESEKIRGELNTVELAIEQADPSRHQELIRRRDHLRMSLPSLENLRWDLIAIAGLLYAVGLLPPGLVLHSALRSLGERPRHRTAIAAQLIGHVGKYVPGKAMVIVLRAGALSIDDVRPVRATISVFMETLLMMAVGAAVAGVVICWLPVPAWMTWSALGVAVLATIPTLPPILTGVAARVSKVDPDQLHNGHDATSSLRFFMTGWAWSLTSWVLIGASFTLLVSAIPSATAPPSFAILCAVSTAAIALAMVVGFGSLLPGGAGVRELVLTTVLATSVGAAQALLAAIAARLMFIAIEGLCACAAWLWLRRSANDSRGSKSLW